MLGIKGMPCINGPYEAKIAARHANLKVRHLQEHNNTIALFSQSYGSLTLPVAKQLHKRESHTNLPVQIKGSLFEACTSDSKVKC